MNSCFDSTLLDLNDLAFKQDQAFISIYIYICLIGVLVVLYIYICLMVVRMVLYIYIYMLDVCTCGAIYIYIYIYA